MEYKNCPNCAKKLNGLMVSKYIVKSTTTDFINSFHEPNAEAYCNECAEALIRTYQEANENKKQALIKDLNKDLHVIPIVTTHSPLNWQYGILDMITTQSVSGTGFLTEITSSWTDITGGQSSSMTNKLSSGENICKSRLRYQCALLGGNAIIATDIDYSEVGGGKGMLMVCMAGTAINLHSIEVIFKNKTEQLAKIKEVVDELKSLLQIRYPNLEYAL
ncbi:MAG: heavy metal-binding domain-containing protein [Pedobacter sp.]|nr:MAG: heavy metal-binding domain-containing protein [Pedobacter sp.]